MEPAYAKRMTMQKWDHIDAVISEAWRQKFTSSSSNKVSVMVYKCTSNVYALKKLSYVSQI